jgi:hypothetical protein
MLYVWQGKELAKEKWRVASDEWREKKSADRKNIGQRR